MIKRFLTAKLNAKTYTATMEDSETGGKLSSFLDSGVYRFEDSTAVFIDPVRVLNRSYTRFRVSPSTYYSRSFESKLQEPRVCSNSRKRKRKEKKPQTLNDRERAADQRHQVIALTGSLPSSSFFLRFTACLVA